MKQNEEKYWSSRGISLLGSSLTSLLITYYAVVFLKLSGPVIAIIQSGPLFVSLLSPLYVTSILNIVGLRRTLIMSDVFCACLLFFSSIFVWRLGPTPMLLIVLSISIAAVRSITSAARFASFPEMFGSDRLALVNSINQSVETSMQAIGSLISGWLISLLGGVAFFLSDSLSFLVSAFCQRAFDWHSREQYRRGKNKYLDDVISSFRIIFKNFNLMILVLLSSFSNLVISFSTLPLMLLLINEDNIQYKFYTLILGIGSLGAVLGGWISAKLFTRVESTSVFQICSVCIYGLLFLSYSSLTGNSFFTIGIAVLIDFSIGIVISVYVIANLTSLQKLIQADERAAVGTGRNTLNSAFSILGTFISGFCVEIVPARSLVFLSGALLILIGFIFGICHMIYRR